MIRVLVYHSDLERLRFLCRLISAYFQKARHSYNLVAYRRWEDADKYLQENNKKEDIAFVDCSNLPNAVALVKKIRQDNDRTSWVYMDGEMKGLLQMLLLRPSMYLPDATKANQVGAAIRCLDGYHQARQKNHEFCFKCDGEHLRIPYEEISYFESSAKKVALHLAGGNRTYYFTAKLDDIAALLPNQFLRCHQSYLVNLQMVRLLDEKEHMFVLGSNEEIFISRRNYAQAKERYQAYLDRQER